MQIVFLLVYYDDDDDDYATECIKAVCDLSRTIVQN